MSRDRVPTRMLPSGDEMPLIGFGTWRLHDDTLRAALDAAIAAGYRHFDTAQAYGNEADIGDHLAEYDREEFFITSKVVGSDLAYDRVIRTCRESIDRLGTDYLDLYMIHLPNPAISLRETLSAMATLVKERLVRNVGVSNFDAYRLSCAQHIADVPIAVNQIEFHPIFQQPGLVEYCTQTDVVIEAAAPLGRGAVFSDELVTSISEKYGKSNAQVVLRWILEQDIVSLPRSSNPAHVEENIDILDWKLTEDDRHALDDHPRDEAIYTMPTAHWENDDYGIIH